MLQSSASKTSSSSSLRQQRLKEIAEDNEESAPAEKASASHVSAATTSPDASVQRSQEVDGLPASAARAKALLAKHKQEHSQSVTIPSIGQSTRSSLAPDDDQPTPQPTPHLTPQPTEQPTSPAQFPARSSSITVDKELPEPPPQPALDSTSTNDTAIPRLSVDFSLPPLESDSDDDVRRPVPKDYNPIRHTNHLSAAETTNISKWSDDVLASTRSKQKRAPQPHGDVQGRPKTSGNSEDSGPSRRVANLPTSVRVTSRSSGQSSRPGSRQSTRSVPARFVPSPNLPPPLPSPTFAAAAAQRPLHNRPPPSQASSAAMDKPAITPEKMRLMKALQMRKRNHLLAQRSASAAATSPNPLASIDSSKSGSSDLSTAPSSTNTGNPDSASQPPELGSTDEAQTTSPTSITTTSEGHSTKPSSMSENSAGVASRTSLSSDTNSSTTPKADAEKKHEQGTKHDHPANPTPEPLRKSDTAPARFASPHTDLPKQPLKEDTPAIHDTIDSDTEASSHQRDRELSGNSYVHGATENMSASKIPRKRYQFEGTITIPPSSVGGSDLSDDDSFMEELQHATVHEARPLVVNRTPVTPVLSRAPTKDFRDLTPVQTALSKSRSSSNGSQVSTPDRHRTASRAGSTRSLSTALPQWPPPSEPVPVLPKQKPAIGGNISKRIKTFEGLSQRENSTSSLLTTKDQTARTSGLSNMLKRASFLTQSNKGESTPEGVCPKTTSSPLRAGFESPEEKASSRLLVQRPGTSTEVFAPTHKGETVSVTARIVREPIKAKSAHATGDSQNLHRSPLIVEHERSENVVRPGLPQELATQSMDSLVSSPKSSGRRFSFTSHKSGVKNPSPTETRFHRMSFAGHQKKSQKSPSETSSMTDEKRASRTSRMLKRLSGLGRSRNRDSVMLTSPTQESLHPDTIEEQVEATDSTIRHVVDIGEVNVQFPETLLWKRRFLRVDDQGYLIFAPPTNDFSTRGKSRKIHLDDLHKPTLPDLEREEMAWSILLDVKAGGTFQCACESKPAQSHVLNSEWSNELSKDSFR